MYGELKSVCIKSKQDGLMHCLGQADLIKTGIPNDVHCDGGDFQVSILPEVSKSGILYSLAILR